ncbi:MAG: OmpH family outer membrane protein [Planctomycetota bacterium]
MLTSIARCVRTIGLAAGVLVVVLLLSPASSAAQVGRTGSPVAVVEINRVLELLEEKAVREQELRVFLTDLERRVNDLQDEVRGLAADLNILPRDQPEYEEKRQEFLRKQFQVRVEAELAELFAGERKKEQQIELFKKIQDGIKRYAEREGILLVLNNDGIIDIPTEAPIQQVEAAIVSRRVLYASPDIDISEDVAVMLNNEYRAGRP